MASRSRAASGADDEVFAALADPMRRTILRIVVEDGPLTATSVARQVPISRQGVAKHLAVLSDAGLVHSTRAGRETRFEASLRPLRSVTRWVDDVGRKWDQRLARLRRITP